MKITNYSKIAEKYDNNQYRRDEIKFDSDLYEYISNNHKQVYNVLDLSCGTGLYLEKQMHNFNKNNINWNGLDASEEMLEKASQRLQNVELSKGYAEKMPYGSETFDFIINNYAFHHYSNKGSALDEVHRVLKRDGIFKLHNIAIHDMPNWWIYHYFPTAYYEDLKRFWNKEVIFNELKVRGFNVTLKMEYHREEIQAKDYLAYVENKDISILTLINDKEYQEGLDRVRHDVKNNPFNTIVNDFAELFCIAKKL